MALYDDGSVYDSGVKYIELDGVPSSHSVEREVHSHRLSTRINYTAVNIPGAIEAFRVFEIRLRVAPDSQFSFTHETFVDMTTPSERLAAVINHAGSEFILSNVQMLAQQKKHQPSG